MVKLATRKAFAADRTVRRTSDGFFTDGHAAILERLCNFTAIELKAVENIHPTIESLVAQDRPLYTIGRATNLLIEEKGRKKNEKILYRALRSTTNTTLESLIWVNNRSYVALMEACSPDILVLDPRTPVLFESGPDLVGVIMPYNAGPIHEAVYSL